MNVLSIFQQANKGLSLTPGQRAFLKLIKGFAIAGGSAVFVYVGPLATLLQNSQFSQAAHLAMVAALAGILHAIDKYYTSQGDAPLATAAGQLAGGADQQVQKDVANDVKTPS